MVEQLICNQLVGGSIPFSGSTGRNAVLEQVQDMVSRLIGGNHPGK